ncbi:hypothetical protein [Candidatus Izimaplasma sp. HR1]|uniref:hypothetical protein n=1 Tax=Candidatus Izimoplasma sp. HR1 TaxID=1541959 RepID=UPI00130D5556
MNNTPVMYSDISGESAVAIGILVGLTMLELVLIVAVVVVVTVMILEIVNDFYYTKKLLSYISKSSSLPYRGDANVPGRLYDENGNLKQKRWYGEDGLPERDRDYDHPGSMDLPHDHDWVDGKRKDEHLNVDYDKYPDDKNGDDEE